MTLDQLYRHAETAAYEADMISDTAGDSETHQYHYGFAEAMREMMALLQGRCK